MRPMPPIWAACWPLRIARPLGIPAFICDPVTVDEMTDEARISGHPVLPRMMTGHALNCRAMAPALRRRVCCISLWPIAA